MRLLAALVALCAVPLSASAQLVIPIDPAGSMGWGKWHFQWSIGDTNHEGLMLTDVRWKGVSVLYKASLPVIRVKYRGGGGSITAGCGPYMDRIHSGNIVPMTTFLGTKSKVIARIINPQLLEIAVQAQIGGYHLYQAYYFDWLNQTMQPKLYSSGWSCADSGHENDHRHHPYWRLDFDVETPSNEAWSIHTGPGVMPWRFNDEGNDRRAFFGEDLAWTFNKPGSSRNVLVRYPDSDWWDEPGTPWFNLSPTDVAVRRYKPAEDKGWPFGSTEDLGFETPRENLLGGTDIVFWAIGHLSHEWSRDDVAAPHWHWTGPMIQANW